MTPVYQNAHKHYYTETKTFSNSVFSQSIVVVVRCAETSTVLHHSKAFPVIICKDNQVSAFIRGVCMVLDVLMLYFASQSSLDPCAFLSVGLPSDLSF